MKKSDYFWRCLFVVTVALFVSDMLYSYVL
nr:MAG TPA: hypothetical protein [Caudoviricetes sp.]